MPDCPDGYECIPICSDYISIGIGFQFDPIRKSDRLLFLEGSTLFKKFVIAEMSHIDILNDPSRGANKENFMDDPLAPFFSAKELGLEGYQDSDNWKMHFKASDITKFEDEKKRAREAVVARVKSKTYTKLSVSDTELFMGCEWDSTNKCWKKTRVFNVQEKKGKDWTLARAFDAFRSAVNSYHPKMKKLVDGLSDTDIQLLKKLNLTLSATWNAKLK